MDLFRYCTYIGLGIVSLTGIFLLFGATGIFPNADMTTLGDVLIISGFATVVCALFGSD